MTIFSYMKSFVEKKNKKQPFGKKLRRHEAEPWRNQSRAPTELFCRGNFPSGGGNPHHRHDQRSYHREGFIKDFSKISRPPTNLLQKDIPFVFDDDCVEAFEILKKALISAPIVQPPD